MYSTPPPLQYHHCYWETTTIDFNEEENSEGIKINLDPIDEIREEAVEKMKAYKDKTDQHFAKGVRERSFKIGDLVLRDRQASDPTNTGKLMPKWEGPYKVTEIIRPVTYKLKQLDGQELQNTWHVARFRKYYQ